jgi:hypothetical protein
MLVSARRSVYPENLRLGMSGKKVLGCDLTIGGFCFKPGRFDVPGQSERAQGPNAPPVHVDFIPRVAVARGLRVGMVIVVPAFAKRKNGHPEAICRSVAGIEALRSPNVGCGVDQPSEVQAHHGANKNAPEHPRPAADEIEDNCHSDRGNHVPLADPEMKFVFTKIGYVRKQFGPIAVHGAAR